jgi:hypothetical protein
MVKRFLKSTLFCGVAALSVLAKADGPPCGMSPASWNAPNGAAVFSKGPGPIDAVLSAVGEYRSHSMLSHGPGGGVSHATAKTPPTNAWPAICSTPLDPNGLRNGQPGLEQINQGGIYAFLHDPTHPTSYLRYQVWDAARAASVADTMWWGTSIFEDRSTSDSTVEIDRPVRNGARVPYSFFQYKNIERTNLVPSSASNNGMVCSTFLSYAHATGGMGVIPGFAYSHAQLNAVGNALFSSIVDECHRSPTWLPTALGLGVICTLGLSPVIDPCAAAANQVANCMATNRCDTADGSIWRAVASDPAQTAYTISPDRIAGAGVHHDQVDANRQLWWNSTFLGAPTWAVNVWASDVSYDVQFNSGGSVYGCWN